MNSAAPLQSPQGETKILLHCCCAPCAGGILQRMVQSGLEPTLYFYNPNIYPREEYEHRKQEVIRYAGKMRIPFVDADQDDEAWMEFTRGYEEAPERSERCRLCFKMRLEKTAVYATEHGFKVFATSLGISRWKDLEQVNSAGRQAAFSFSGLTYWDYNWRLRGGTELREQVAREENFYRQKYCGCIYSLRLSIQRQIASKSHSISTQQP